MTIELPLWLVIVLASVLSIDTIYFMIGDFLARVFYKKMKDEEQKEKENKRL